MKNNHPLTGSMVALITPMFEDGALDFEALKLLVDFHINAGTSAIVSVGTTGESATLTQNEHYEVMQKTIEFAQKRIKVIAGTGANSTAEATELTQYAKEIGADACLLVTPYYNKPTQNGLYQHYKTIAEAVDIDQILYNVPSRTALDLELETVLRLSEIPRIIGLKDATGDLSVGRALMAQCPEDFLLYSGDDASALEFILMGGDGGISVTANIVPQQVAAVYRAARSGERVLAQSLDAPLQDLHQHLFVESNPIPVKWALQQMGKCGGGIRLPLTPLAETYHPILKQDLDTLGVI